jgi:hypothetical protein
VAAYEAVRGYVREESDDIRHAQGRVHYYRLTSRSWRLWSIATRLARKTQPAGAARHARYI